MKMYRTRKTEKDLCGTSWMLMALLWSGRPIPDRDVCESLKMFHKEEEQESSVDGVLRWLSGGSGGLPAIKMARCCTK